MTRGFLPGLIIALGVLALGLVVAFTVGRYPVTLAELADVLRSRVTGRPSTAPAAVENVVLLVRGPRVLAAVMVGAALAVAGTAFQGLFRNPLVSPTFLAPPPGRPSAPCSAFISRSASSVSRALRSSAG